MESRILTGNDVHSVYLTREESERLEKEYKNIVDAIVKGKQKEFDRYYDTMEKTYDEVARKHGFDGFEENNQGTGVRNYTALHKGANKETKERLEAFSIEIEQRMKDIFPIMNKATESLSKQKEKARQEYLQKIDAITRPRWYAKRISDVNLFVSENNPHLVFVRCKIDGIWQGAEQLSRQEQMNFAQGKCTASEIALSHYRTVLEENNQERGMKR